MNFQYFLLDDVISRNELLWINSKLLDTPKWTLSQTSKAKKNILLTFPAINVQDKNNIHCEFLSGYFTSIIFRIDNLLRKRYSFNLPSNILRIHVGAKSSFTKTEKHIDYENEKFWTILGFLSPNWNNMDGGEFYLENNKIEYKSGRFIIFPSNIEHDGGFVKNEKLSYWRIAVNIILGP